MTEVQLDPIFSLLEVSDGGFILVSLPALL
jgi:hypothetical protein